VIPIVIRRKTSLNAEVSDSPPQTEISSLLTTVVDTANTAITPQLLDLREIENAKQVQQRLIDLGFLFGTADGIWGYCGCQGRRARLRPVTRRRSTGPLLNQICEAHRACKAAPPQEDTPGHGPRNAAASAFTC
jgi:hypothetical protein